MRKPAFCICKNKDFDQLLVTMQLISAFVWATYIVQFLYILNLKFQAFSYHLCLHSPVCVEPDLNSRRVFFLAKWLMYS